MKASRHGVPLGVALSVGALVRVVVLVDVLSRVGESGVRGRAG